MKYGLVLEGGSRKCLYTAGVLDCIMEEGIDFPYVIGVSAGAHAAVNYVSEQKGRLRSILNPNLLHDDPVKLLTSGVKEELRRMTYVYSYEKFPFDFKTFFNSKKECEICATNAVTGLPEYFNERSDEKRLLDILNATCAVPMIFPVAQIDNNHYVDGCITDSVPFERALKKGCDKVVVILTKVPGDAPVDFGKMRVVLEKKFGREYPELFEALMNRYDAYDRQSKLMWQLQKEGKLYIFRPEKDLCNLFDVNQEKLDESYQYGREQGMLYMKELKDFLAG